MSISLNTPQSSSFHSPLENFPLLTRQSVSMTTVELPQSERTEMESNDCSLHSIPIYDFSFKNRKLILNKNKLSLDFHPYTIQRLHEFHLQKSASKYSLNHPDSISFLDLVGLLAVESELDIGKLIVHLKGILWPAQPELEMDEDGDDMEGKDVDEVSANFAINFLHSAINASCERIQYSTNCWIWEMKTYCIPSIFQSLFKCRRLERETVSNLFKEYSEVSDAQELASMMTSPKRIKKTAVEERAAEIAPQNTIISTIDDSLKRKKHQPLLFSKKSVQTTAAANSLLEQPSNQKKVSQFFTPIIKSSQEDFNKCTSLFDEIFPPFFLKENTSISPINRFQSVRRTPSSILKYADSIQNLMDEDVPVYSSKLRSLLSSSLFSSLQYFHIDCQVLANFTDDSLPFIVWAKKVRRIFYKSPAQGKVMGAFDGDLCVKFKLFQFHDNYRPAYFGTMQKPKPTCLTPRNPFKRDISGLIQYSVDSDLEWEEEELGDVEIIATEDEVSEAEECLSFGSDESDDDFVINEENSTCNNERKSRLFQTPTIATFIVKSCNSVDVKGAFNSMANISTTHSDSIGMNGSIQNYADETKPEDNLLETDQCLIYMYSKDLSGKEHGIFAIYYETPGMPTDPFACENIALQEPSSSSISKKPIQFTPEMLPLLIELANDSLLSIEMLHAEFVRRTDKKVSKRSFQDNLQQIASRQRISGQNRYKWILKNPILPVSSSSEMTMQ